MNKHGVSGRCFAETNVKYFKSDAKDIAEKKCTFYGKLKNSFMCILEILSVDKKQLSKMWISLHIFFIKDFVDRFEYIYLKNGFL